MRSLFPALFLLILIFASETPSAHAELKTGMAADVVVGQKDFNSGSAHAGQGTPSASTLQFPFSGVFVDGSRRFFVVEGDTNRVLIWNQVPTTNFAPADVVIGQPNFTSGAGNNGGLGPRTLFTPADAFVQGGRLYVSDIDNNRVLVWNSIPTTNFAPADFVLGQPDFISNTANAGGNPAANTLSAPRGITGDGRRLLVADGSNHRILIWDPAPTSTFEPADQVLGQPDFTSNTANNGAISARSLNLPLGLKFDGKNLLVADFSNSRVLIWTSFPTEKFQAANVVLGQPDFKTRGVNSRGLSASSINEADGLHSDGKRVYVSDQRNNRVLIWNSIPTVNGAPADVVLGQRDFVSNGANAGGGPTKRTLRGPIGIFTDGKRLFVNDTANNRILIYNIGSSAIDLSPQFKQGKAVLGKVFWDLNGNGRQDRVLPSLRGYSPETVIARKRSRQ